MKAIYVSCRHDFEDPRKFSDAPLLFRVDLVDTKSVVPDLAAIELMGARPLVLIHGYKSPSTDQAWQSYSKIAANVADFGYSSIVAVFWPGGELVVSFPFAARRADLAGARLRGLLRAIPSADVQTHSLGARVALKALSGVGVCCRNLILSAPAVDDECLEYGEEFNGAAMSVKERVGVFHSVRDEVLRLSYPVGDLGDHDKALGWKGPERRDNLPENTYVVDCGKVVGKHGGYRDSKEYYSAWRQMVDGAAMPRFVTLG